MDEHKGTETRKARATSVQSVTRALDIIDAIADRPMMLPELAARVGISRPQCYRLAAALTERGLLSTSGRSGYSLGPRIGELAAIMERSATK
ncbi:helix-turn-helix domain-containing protein [Sphingomonas sp. MG17]|uniref:Helix-turn-helix domain-containing protein n=1 Tax=Sphingomonas tagetis TaxID=2949092 RepID=A0A9X2HM82_9SPHN|nr:helix-turn-helix domain-containing protein [Sphingomonas tagetis]MCP3732217.1 helix-turn-helix domain-containing protein [Sphingomonas tagetis]